MRIFLCYEWFNYSDTKGANNAEDSNYHPDRADSINSSTFLRVGIDNGYRFFAANAGNMSQNSQQGAKGQQTVNCPSRLAVMFDYRIAILDMALEMGRVQNYFFLILSPKFFSSKTRQRLYNFNAKSR